MYPIGSSIHALAVASAAGWLPKDGEHTRTLARLLGVTLPDPLSPAIRRDGVIVFCPYAKAAYKQWPQDRWDVLRAALEQQGEQVIAETPDMTLPQLSRLIATAKCVIAVDSGPIHMADARGVPVIGLYAATSAVTYGPYNQRARCIDKHREASDAQGLTYSSVRHLSKGHAMHSIKVDDVLAKVYAHG